MKSIICCMPATALDGLCRGPHQDQCPCKSVSRPPAIRSRSHSRFRYSRLSPCRQPESRPCDRCGCCRFSSCTPSLAQLFTELIRPIAIATEDVVAKVDMSTAISIANERHLAGIRSIYSVLAFQNGAVPQKLQLKGQPRPTSKTALPPIHCVGVMEGYRQIVEILDHGRSELSETPTRSRQLRPRMLAGS